MTWVKLRGKFGSSSSDEALTTLGKIIVALSAISGVLGGLIDIGQSLTILFSGSLPAAYFLVVVIMGGIRITLGYGYYLLLDVNKGGLLVSIAKFFAEIGAGLSIVLSPLAIIAGLVMLFFNPKLGVLLVIFGCIWFCTGLGVMFFIEERDKVQIAKQIPESGISQQAS
jgi:hypothetical protein